MTAPNSVFIDENILVFMVTNPTDKYGYLIWEGIDQMVVQPQEIAIFDKQMLLYNYMTGNEIICSLPEMIIEVKREKEKKNDPT